MTYQAQVDFGTPASRSSDMVTCTIDGRDVTVAAGTSVMRAAAEQANSELKEMPPSDYDDSATPFEDYCSLIASPAIREGMVVHLRNVRLEEAQFKHLNQLKKLQLSVSLEAPHVYVSHWEKKFKTAYQHLIFKDQ